MATDQRTTGAERAAQRLAAKLAANHKLYAGLPVKPDSRQVRRRPSPSYSWDVMGTRTRRRG